ncbi:MAG: TadE/TadG family type IV pilus assembly protein [Micavibrio sp.]
METAMLFPILLVMLFGVYDVGHAITANHKMITATQVAADLITRGQSVSDSDINQAIEAAGLAMQPYESSAAMGIDIVSVRYDEDDEPVQVWRETRNMTEDLYAIGKSVGLGTEGEGAVIVTIIYDYVPTFGSIVINAFRMKETAFARGRRVPVITRE